MTVGLMATAIAQTPSPTHRVFHFLNCISVTTGTNSLYGVTNLNSYSGIYTNQSGQWMTNNAGTGVAIGIGTNDTFNLLRDAPLWSLRNGEPAVYWPTNNGQTEFLNRSIGFARLLVRGVSTNAAGTGTVHLRFVPLYDGTNETTLAGDVFDLPIVMNGVTPISLSTNAPMYLWVGAKALRLREIYNTSASNQGQSWLFDVSLEGYIP